MAPGQVDPANEAFCRGAMTVAEGITPANFPLARKFDAWTASLNARGLNNPGAKFLAITASLDGLLYPLVINASGTFYHRQIQGTLKGNTQLVNLTFAYLESLIMADADSKLDEIAIIVPYLYQRELYMEVKNSNLDRWADLTISTAHIFQGQERPVTFIDTTCAANLDGKNGFVDDDHMLAVFATRHQSGMIVMCDLAAVDLLSPNPPEVTEVAWGGNEQNGVVPETVEGATTAKDTPTTEDDDADISEVGEVSREAVSGKSYLKQFIAWFVVHGRVIYGFAEFPPITVVDQIDEETLKVMKSAQRRREKDDDIPDISSMQPEEVGDVIKKLNASSETLPPPTSSSHNPHSDSANADTCNTTASSTNYQQNSNLSKESFAKAAEKISTYEHSTFQLMHFFSLQPIFSRLETENTFAQFAMEAWDAMSYLLNEVAFII